MKLLDVTAATAMLCVVFASVCAASNAATNSDVPEVLKVQAGEQLSLEAHASGVQIYECKASKDDATRQINQRKWRLRSDQKHPALANYWWQGPCQRL